MSLEYMYINVYATVKIQIERCAMEFDWGKSGVSSTVLLSSRADEQ